LSEKHHVVHWIHKRVMKVTDIGLNFNHIEVTHSHNLFGLIFKVQKHLLLLSVCNLHGASMQCSRHMYAYYINNNVYIEWNINVMYSFTWQHCCGVFKVSLLIFHIKFFSLDALLFFFSKCFIHKLLKSIYNSTLRQADILVYE
jgi:hypothetical protein